jgi:hypothetical protein
MFRFISWLVSLRPSQGLALWVALSLSLYVVSVQLAWRTRDLESGFLGENIRWLDDWRFRSLARQLLRFSFYVVIPYGLIVSHRLLSGPTLGLVGGQSEGFLGWDAAAWLHGLGWILTCGVSGLFLLMGMWWPLTKRLDRESVFSAECPRPATELFWDALFLQVHWAFYRAAAASWFGATEYHWATLVGLSLIALEAFGDPRFHLDWRWPSMASGWVQLAAVATMTTISYYITRNLWLGIVLHWGMSWTLDALRRWLTRWSLRASAKEG